MTPVRPVTRAVIPLPPGYERNTFRTSLALSPDGRLVAYVGRSDQATGLFLRALDELDAKPIANTEGASLPFFSPDGQWVGFELGNELMKVSVSGGAPVTIADTQVHSGASWGPDGRIVYTAREIGGLTQILAEGEPEILTVSDRGRREKTHRWAEVLPGGKAVLFTLCTGDILSFDDASIAVLSLETGEYRVLIEGGMHARYSATGVAHHY